MGARYPDRGRLPLRLEPLPHTPSGLRLSERPPPSALAGTDRGTDRRDPPDHAALVRLASARRGRGALPAPPIRPGARLAPPVRAPRWYLDGPQPPPAARPVL